MSHYDENGQIITGYNGPMTQTSIGSASALQIARLALHRELERSDMTNQYTREEITEALSVLGDILAQRGCEELSAEADGSLTHLIDIVVYG